jgi:hypothetical protein
VAKETTNGRDNNKRLAALESGVSALVIALTANGVTLEDGADPIAAAVGRIKLAAELEAKAEETTPGELAAIARAETAEKRIGELATIVAGVVGVGVEAITDPVAAAAGAFESMQAELAARPASAEEANDGAIEALKAEILELQTDLIDMTDEKNRLANELSAANEGRPIVQQAPEPEPEPEPIVRERPEQAADVGADCGTLDRSEIGELILAGEGLLELAFSNGDYEIVSLQRVTIGARDLVLLEGRFVVGPAVHVKLAATDVPEELAGVGLLFEGAQIGYSAFPERVRMAPGTERRFDRAIAF